MRLKNLTGMRFGMLTVISMTKERKNNQVCYLVQCDCGNKKESIGYLLTSGKSVSCGCKRRIAGLKHGKSSSREYRIWADMRRRCIDERNKNYPYYGGRGISVCDRWQDFSNFIADMGKSQKGQSLDRIDNSGKYEPDNCKWSSLKEQARNRRSNRLINFNGKTMCVSEWAETIGIARDTLKRRLLLGWSVERALTEGAKK